MEDSGPGPCTNLCWVVIRMNAMGFWPTTIEACTAVPQNLVHEIVTAFHSTGKLVKPTVWITPNAPAYPTPYAGYHGSHQPTVGSLYVAQHSTPGQPIYSGSPHPPLPTTQQPFASPLPPALYNPIPHPRHSDPPRNVTARPQTTMKTLAVSNPPMARALPVPINPPTPAYSHPATTCNPHELSSGPIDNSSIVTREITALNLPLITNTFPTDQRSTTTTKVEQHNNIAPGALPNSPNAAPTVWIAMGQGDDLDAVECSTVASTHDILHIRGYLKARPEANLRELCNELLNRQVSISPFKLYRTLRQNNIDFQKDANWEDNLRHARNDFAFNIGAFDPEKLVFIAQFSCNVQYGWEAPSRQRRKRAQRFAVCFVLACTGVVAVRVSDQPADAHTYSSFVKQTLGVMQPLPQDRSVVILAKHRVEDKDEIVKLVDSRSMKCMFIPPTSPDYNPTTHAIASIKDMINVHQKSLAEADSKESVEAIIHHHVCNISELQAWMWFQGSNYA